MERAFDLGQLGKTHAERIQRFSELLRICRSPEAPRLLPSDTPDSACLFRWESPTARLDCLTDPFARAAAARDDEFIKPIGAFFSVTTVLVDLKDAATAALVDTFLKVKFTGLTQSLGQV
jgi:hypothetical protein